jgi:hypothetical protein
MSDGSCNTNIPTKGWTKTILSTSREFKQGDIVQIIEGLNDRQRAYVGTEFMLTDSDHNGAWLGYGIYWSHWQLAIVVTPYRNKKRA